jgi:hypothetical protein
MKSQEEEYLTTKQLSDRIAYAESTLLGFMTKGVLRLGVHYVKPRGRLMFKWTAMKTWVESPGQGG